MTASEDSGVWAAPDPVAPAPPPVGGADLVFTLEDGVYRHEVIAWLRASRWWLSWWMPLVYLPIAVCGLAVGGLALLWDVPGFIFVGLFGSILPVSLWFRPHGLARTMLKRRASEPESHLSVREGRIVVEGSGELSLPAHDVTEIRERSTLWWVLFDRRMVLFVPKQPQIGDPVAFLAALEDARKTPVEVAALPDEGARASFRPPNRLPHIGRYYAAALRNVGFVMLVVFQALIGVAAIGALPWEASRGLVVPLLALWAVLFMLLLFPAVYVLAMRRSSLGTPGSVRTLQKNL